MDVPKFELLLGVRAKFKVVSVDETTVKLEAVTSGSPENDEFFKYPPSGSITLGIVNKLALEQFVAGKVYYVDFSPARATGKDAVSKAAEAGFRS